METQPISANQESNIPLAPQTPFLEPKSTGPSRLPLFILGILTLIFAATSIYFFAKLKKVSFTSSPSSVNLPSPSPSLSPNPSPLLENLNANVKKYTSPSLGISFSYLAKYDSGETISTKEVGNKVYVYSNLLKPESGQYVEVFSKDSSDTLEQAITKTILAGYSTSDCLIVTSMKNISGNETVAPSNYKFARLDVPRSGSEDMGSLGEKFAKCPSPYASFGGMTGFLMDTERPDKFAFFSIGQYALTGDTDNNTWQDTFVFTN